MRLFIDMDQDDDVVAAMAYQGGRKFLVASYSGNGFVVPVQGVKPYSDFVASELPRWTKVIKTAGIKPQ